MRSEITYCNVGITKKKKESKKRPRLQGVQRFRLLTTMTMTHSDKSLVSSKLYRAVRIRDDRFPSSDRLGNRFSGCSLII